MTVLEKGEPAAVVLSPAEFDRLEEQDRIRREDKVRLHVTIGRSSPTWASNRPAIAVGHYFARC